MRKLTTLEFISKAKAKHGDAYSYDCSEYSGRDKSVNIKCINHGMFTQIAGNHLQGKGCVKCANESIGLKIHEAARARREYVVFSEDGLSLQIPLTQGKFAIIDAELYDLIKPYNWSFLNVGYAITTLHNNKSLLMHSLISKEFYNGSLLDHKNRNKLDNRRSNLRAVTTQQNSCNTSGARLSSSKYKGVFYNKRLNKWQANINFGKTTFNLGLHKDEKFAAKLYNEKALELFGEYAYINTI